MLTLAMNVRCRNNPSHSAILSGTARPPQTLARCKQYPSPTIARSSQRVSSNSAIFGVGNTGRFGFAFKIAVRIWHRTFSDRLTTAASSVAFYITLAAIPGIAAVVSVYGLIANPSDVNGASTVLEALLPPGAAQMLNGQLSRIVQSQEHGSASMLGSGAWFIVLLWSANLGMKSFVDALNIIYDQSEERGFFRRIVITLILTLGSVVVLVAILFGIMLLPAALTLLGLDDRSALALKLLRWPAFLILSGAAIAALYRFGPSRKAADWQSIVFGSSVAAVLWIGSSAIFAWYVPAFGSFTALYGSLGAIIAFMLWLSALAVLIGAEVDAAATSREKKCR